LGIIFITGIVGNGTGVSTRRWTGSSDGHSGVDVFAKTLGAPPTDGVVHIESLGAAGEKADVAAAWGDEQSDRRGVRLAIDVGSRR
jgi:hypothetical protein